MNCKDGLASSDEAELFESLIDFNMENSDDVESKILTRDQDFEGARQDKEGLEIQASDSNIKDQQVFPCFLDALEPLAHSGITTTCHADSSLASQLDSSMDSELGVPNQVATREEGEEGAQDLIPSNQASPDAAVFMMQPQDFGNVIQQSREGESILQMEQLPSAVPVSHGLREFDETSGLKPASAIHEGDKADSNEECHVLPDLETIQVPVSSLEHNDAVKLSFESLSASDGIAPAMENIQAVPRDPEVCQPLNASGSLSDGSSAHESLANNLLHAQLPVSDGALLIEDDENNDWSSYTNIPVEDAGSECRKIAAF